MTFRFLCACFLFGASDHFAEFLDIVAHEADLVNKTLGERMYALQLPLQVFECPGLTQIISNLGNR